MLEWHDFVEQLLSEESSFDGISLSFDGTAHSVGVPPIIKASVLMLDRTCFSLNSRREVLEDAC